MISLTPDRSPVTPTPAEAIAHRRAWALEIIRAAGSVGSLPDYSAKLWVVLPDGNLTKLAVAIVVAKCWVTGRDDLTGIVSAEKTAHTARRAVD